ncbi:MAG: thioredoxin family protein [Candidatus Dormibacteria bacterium]
MTGSLAIGDRAPDFELMDTEGLPHRLAMDPPPVATVVVVTCNHCPYALAWHERLLAVARDYSELGVRFLAVNANDADRYPADSYDAMQRRVREEGGWPHPYLHDPTQEMARAWGAQVTPDVFVLDRELRLQYRGAPDAEYSDPGQDGRWLREALDDLLAGREVGRPETRPVGCSVKWRPGPG